MSAQRKYSLAAIQPHAPEPDEHVGSVNREAFSTQPVICPHCHGAGLEVMPGKGARRCRCCTQEQGARLLEQARIPPRYQNCSLANYHPTPNNGTQLQAFNYAFRLVDEYPAVERGLLFTGSCGVGKTHPRNYPCWIGHQLGEDAYRAIERLDQESVAPSGDDIKRMLAGSPKLILLDEVLKYIERTSAVPVHESTLARQAKDFFQNLTVEVSNSKNACMVYSLQMSERESLGNITLLSELDKLANRVDDLRQPVGDEEVIGVVKRRLLAQEPDPQHATTVANAFQDVVTKQRRAAASSDLEQEQAETEGTRLRDEIKGSYPFHPAMLGVMRGRWASVEAFQRTRGALRFLAACLHSIKKSGQGRAMLSPGDVPVADAAVRLALNKELGLNNRPLAKVTLTEHGSQYFSGRDS